MRGRSGTGVWRCHEPACAKETFTKIGGVDPVRAARAYMGAGVQGAQARTAARIHWSGGVPVSPAGVR